MAKLMKQAGVFDRDGGVAVEVTEAPIPTPGKGQVLIKVIVTGTNPKDWKMLVWFPESNGVNTGDDIAGIVEAVGEGVTEFKPGDRVSSFHEMRTPNGSFAEYAIGQADTTFHLPASMTFEEAATIPLAAGTAAAALFVKLGLPEPWVKHRDPSVSDGVVIYGGSTAIGAYAIKLLQKADIHPIYVVAGKARDFVSGLIDTAKGDRLFDYRVGKDALVAEIKEALGARRPKFAFDTVSENGTTQTVAEVLDPAARLTTSLPDIDESGNLVAKAEGVPDGLEVTFTSVGSLHKEEKDFATAWYRLFGRGIREGWFTPHPYESIPGGLEGVGEALSNLRAGKASAVKYVIRVAESA
ncbi:chaperonin 10-like protein [Stachybotrys elegans]|uniref:Chaperonin 10-like protein n=1 Tax=Stachybotrys elegans TaxID=80388 RepID=A0A8K0WU34_9HYPO|nr:chaperonin 10-like protein [Stachybotrys elegans]